VELEEAPRSLGALAILEERLRNGGLPGGHGGDAVASARGGKKTALGTPAPDSDFKGQGARQRRLEAWSWFKRRGTAPWPW
jgi:hypothetical protein